MNPLQTDYPLRIFMLSVLLGMACLTVPWPALATGLGVLTAHFLRWVLACILSAAIGISLGERNTTATPKGDTNG